MQADRWEMRVWFEEGHEGLDRLAREGEDLGAEYRTDVYILTKEDALLPKLRDERLFEVKRRLDRRDGLERWVLETSQPFPLPQEAAGAVLPDAPAHALATPEAFRAFAETFAEFAVVPLRKHRRRFRLGAAEAEIAATSGGLPAASLGIEAARFKDAQAAAERLGIIGLPNKDYGQALRGL